MARRDDSWEDVRGDAQGRQDRRRKRRAAGEGNIRKRRDGKWESRLTTPQGRISLYGATQQEVRDKLAQARRNLDQGISIITDERQTVSDYLEAWLTRKTNLAPSTRVRYTELLRHVTLKYGALRLTRLTPTHLATLYAQLQAQSPEGPGLSSSTVHRVHSALHGALDDAVKLGALNANPTERVTSPKDARHAVEPYTQEEALRLLDAARGDRLEALYVLALATGARLGELLALTWSAVTFDGPQGGTLEIRASLRLRPPAKPADTPDASTTEGPHARRERWELGPTKTSGSRRTIYLQPLAVEALHAHRARQLTERLAAGPLWADHNLVFCDQLGRFLDKSGVSRYSLRPLLTKAGLPQKRFHDLRHTAATVALDRGASLKAVSSQLGHSSITLTANTYGHTTTGMRIEAAKAMGVMLRPTRPDIGRQDE